MEKIKLHADVRALKRAAPHRAKWLCICIDETADWQHDRGVGPYWLGAGPLCGPPIYMPGVPCSAIDLTTGDIHIDGVKVPQSVWVAARKRKDKRAMLAAREAK